MAEFPMGAKVTGDTSGFVGAMGSARKGLAAFTGAAGLATAGVAVLVGLMAGAAIKAAMDYQLELVKLNTLVGITTSQVERWAVAMKGLAAETGKAPADLAKAMFAISSGGARGTAAMELLEHSAKASAIGLGDMSAIGRTAGAMLQAFGDEGLTAERAIDVLTSTVREGNLEASSLAGAFSRVLGPAKAMGSSVEDIGAFMATFTRLGGSTEEASTSLLNVFNLLIKPPKQAREAMEGMGMSLEDIRATIEEDGLLAGLMMMKEGIGDNIDVLGEVIPNVRSLIGFLNTVGLQSESYAEIQDNVNNSLGLTAEGFDTWGESAEAAHLRFGAQVKILATTIGENMLPAVDKFLGKMAEWLEIVNRASSQIPEGFVDPLDRAAAAVERYAGAVGQFDAKVMDDQLRVNTEHIEDAKLALNTLGYALANLMREDETRDWLNASSDAYVDYSGEIGAFQRQVASVTAEIRDQEGTLAEWTGKLDLVIEAQKELARAEQAVKDALVMAQIPTDEATTAKEAAAEAVASLTLRLQEEFMVLEKGEAALIDYQLAELGVGAAARATIADLWERNQAHRDATTAQEDASRASERAAQDELRRLSTLKRARDRERDARQGAADRLEQAKLNDEMREITQIAQEMADSVGSAFEDMIEGTESVSAAFGNMVEEILKQVQRLLIQKGIIEPILDAIVGSWFSAASKPLLPKGGEKLIVPGHIASKNETFIRKWPSITGPKSPASTAQQSVVVQQSITIAPQLIDARDGRRFIEEQGAAIAKVVGDAARQSSSYASMLR